MQESQSLIHVVHASRAQAWVRHLNARGFPCIGSPGLSSRAVRTGTGARLCVAGSRPDALDCPFCISGGHDLAGMTSKDNVLQVLGLARFAVHIVGREFVPR